MMGKKRTWMVLLAWFVAACLGAVAWTHLGDRLSTSVDIPGSESQHASRVLHRHFADSDQGSLLVVFRSRPAKWRSPAFLGELRASLDRAAKLVAARPSPLHSVDARESYAELVTPLSTATVRPRVEAVERALGKHPSATVEVTGFPVIATELTEVIATDLHRAELVALPITALILIFFFRSLATAAIPLLFGAATISVTMGLVWIEARLTSIPVYATNVVTLVGIALAIDYSMLYVARFREEQRSGVSGSSALSRTRRTAGRALVTSGAVVAAGLIPLAFVPIPFFSGLGAATVVIPVVSVVAAMTLLPALLSLLEAFGGRTRWRLRAAAEPARPAATPTLANRLVDLVMGRTALVAIVCSVALVALSLPALGLELSGGSSEYVRRVQAQMAGGDAGASVAPDEVIVDTGRAQGTGGRRSRAHERRLVRDLSRDPGVSAIQAPVEARSRARAHRLGLLDPSGRFARIRVVTDLPSGSAVADALVTRLREHYVPRAGLPRARTWVGGAAASDHDFVAEVQAGVPLIALAEVVIMYLILVGLLRSLVVPLKAIAMSAVSVTAACGVLVMLYQWGWGSVLGLPTDERIEAWVPVLLFAALFGISTDYEIFMVTRMREEWLHSGNNDGAVRTGLRLVGGIVSASALVMITIFFGFATSRVASLQQFGIGLVVGVVLDATVVRLLLVPALMKIMGRWNWWFPLRPEAPAAGEAVRGVDGR